MPAPEFAVIVLAGGRSQRLGRDKASEMLLGRPMLQHVLDRVAGIAGEAVVVKARGQALPEVRWEGAIATVEDAYPESGPLGGLFTGLSALKAPAALAVACDMPLLSEALARELFSLLPGNDVVVPIGEEFAQPLCAVYSKTCLPAIQRRLEQSEFKLMGFFDQVRVRELPAEEWRRLDPEGLSFMNVNRQEDLDRAKAILSAGHRG